MSRAERQAKKDKKGEDIPSNIYIIGGRGVEGEPLSSAEHMDSKVLMQEWVPIPPMPEARWGASAASWGNKIWVFGGNHTETGNRSPILSTATVYDPKHETWTPLPPMSERRAHACAIAVGKKIYVCGGFGGDHGADHPLDSAERFDPNLHQWEAMPKMSAKRFNAASACLGPLLFIFGGSTDNPNPLKSVERFDARDNKQTWQGFPEMSERRQGAAAAILGGMPFICGGHDGITCLDTAEKLTPDGRPWLDGGTGGKWQAGPSMSTPRYCLVACTALSCDKKAKVFVFGGHNGLERLRDVECLDDAGTEWEPVPKNINPIAPQRKMDVRAGAALGILMAHSDKHDRSGSKQSTAS